MKKRGVDLLRLALAIVFIWFGLLKVIGMSPARELVEKTVFWLPRHFFVPFLGCWEMIIGIGLLFRKLIPFTLGLLLFHMACTFLPFFITPGMCFDAFPWCPSLLGQYIIKTWCSFPGRWW